MRLRVLFKTIIFALLLSQVVAANPLSTPIVIAPGVGVASAGYEYVFPLKRLLEAQGHTVFVANTPIFGSVELRGETLAREINRLVPTGKIHIIGHSMGGIDARMAISKYGLGDRTLSLFSLASPHRGSRMADCTLKLASKSMAAVEVARVFKKLMGDNISAIESLTTAYLMEEFNPNIQDHPQVKYFSIAYELQKPVYLNTPVPFFWLSNKFLKDQGEGPNDGIVGSYSSSWGKLLGVLNRDHWLNALGDQKTVQLIEDALRQNF